MSRRSNGGAQLGFERAALRASGKSVVIDGVVLYAEGGGEGAKTILLRRLVALVNAEPGGTGAEHSHDTLTLSTAGRRLDHSSSGVAVRVRDGRSPSGPALLADLARHWNACLPKADAFDSSRPAVAMSARRSDALRLHRYHLAPSAHGVTLEHEDIVLQAQVSADDPDEARAFAWRLALTWNMAEGWPSTVLEAGALRALDDAVHDLVTAYERNEDYAALVPVIAARLRERDALADLTAGQAHDCTRCLSAEDKADEAAREAAPAP